MTIILSNRLYVPREQVSSLCLEDWTYELEGEEDLLTIMTYQSIGDYIGFHRGNIKKIKKYWDFDKIKDERKIIPFKEKVKFIGKEGKGLGSLREEQKDVLIKWLQNGPGIIQAPPRWGKTVWASALIATLKQKTLFMAHEISLLQQMEEEFRRWTNINELEEELGYKLVGIFKDWDTVYPVLTLATYQKFIRPSGQAWLYKHRDDWGLVGIDECHRVTSQCYTDVTSKINSYYRLGLTATPYHTKTELHCIEFDVLGEVVAKGTTEQLSVDLSTHRTEYNVEKFSRWDQLISQLIEDKDRNLEICKWVVNDVNNGHNVLITTDRQKHPVYLKEILNKIAPGLKVAIITGSVTGNKRKSIRDKIKKREIDITIAMNRIIQLGWNIPAWSCLHNTLPTTHPENWYQRISRIRTPDPKKLKPLCRIYTSKNAWIPAMKAYTNMISENAEQYKFPWLNWEEQQLPKDLASLTIEEIDSW